MVNYMSQVAKMLEVELGEEFECNNGYKYVLREDGIIESKYIDKFSTNTFKKLDLLCTCNRRKFYLSIE